MVRWSLAAELLAFILMIMIALFYYDRKQAKTVRRRLFECGLWMGEGSILLNAVCVYTIENYERVPVWLNMLLNSAYFWLVVCTCSVMAAYLFDLLLEHVYSRYCRTRAAVGLGILTGGYTLLVATNFWTGWMFYFDKEGNYHRGILNKSGYAILVMELILLGICYVRNRPSVGKNVIRVMRTLPPILLLIAIFQLAFPELLLNGTIMTFGMLIIFVNFQHFQVERDSLTGIGNRKNFYEELRLRLRGRQRFQVLWVSLNDFAAVNEQFGYRKGDEYLYHIARWMEECTKEGRAFRFGNVTFTLLCPYVDEEDSQRLLARMEQKFEEPWVLGDVECHLKASFGSMPFIASEKEATEVVEMLTFLVQLSKTGENQKVLLDEGAEEIYRKAKKMEQLLQEGLEQERFEVWYQPIFNCRKQQFDSAEALVRLRDGKGNLISPADFIPLAEKNGLIEKIGWKVWEMVCQFLGQHPQLPLQSVSVNMSAQQFTNPKLCQRMQETLNTCGVSANQVKLEITERVILKDEKYMSQMMRQFSQKGFLFCVDDFGVGFSNFASVMHLPFEFIKFDKSLIEKTPISEKDRQVVQTMMELFHNMGFKVVAEGVETKEQQEVIQQIGADYIQGFYYAGPMPEEEFAAFMNQRGK